MNPTHKTVLSPALDLYCEWLNVWITETDPGQLHRYEPSQFLRYERDLGLWGSYDLRAIVPGYHDLYVFAVTDGDEGGPSVLYVWARHENGGLEHISQEFDTTIRDIWDREQGFLNTP